MIWAWVLYTICALIAGVALTVVAHGWLEDHACRPPTVSESRVRLENLEEEVRMLRQWMEERFGERYDRWDDRRPDAAHSVL